MKSIWEEIILLNQVLSSLKEDLVCHMKWIHETPCSQFLCATHTCLELKRMISTFPFSCALKGLFFYQTFIGKTICKKLEEIDGHLACKWAKGCFNYFLFPIHIVSIKDETISFSIPCIKDKCDYDSYIKSYYYVQNKLDYLTSIHLDCPKCLPSLMNQMFVDKCSKDYSKDYIQFYHSDLKPLFDKYWNVLAKWMKPHFISLLFTLHKAIFTTMSPSPIYEKIVFIHFYITMSEKILLLYFSSRQKKWIKCVPFLSSILEPFAKKLPIHIDTTHL